MVDYRQMAAEAARRYNIPVDLFLAQINQESRFNPRAVSPAGAIGLGQIMPGTAKELGISRSTLYGKMKKLNIPGR